MIEASFCTHHKLKERHIKFGILIVSVEIEAKMVNAHHMERL